MAKTLYRIQIYPKGTPDAEKHKYFCMNALKYKGTFINENDEEEEGLFNTIPGNRNPSDFVRVHLTKAKTKDLANKIHARNFKGDKNSIVEIITVNVND